MWITNLFRIKIRPMIINSTYLGFRTSNLNTEQVKSDLECSALCVKEPVKIDLCTERIEPCTIEVPVNPKDWELEVLKPDPEEYHNRVAFIRKRPKNVMQQGTSGLDTWIVNYHYAGSWENPLIGWVSTGDAYSPIRLVFNNLDEAIHHCEKYKIKYEIEKPKETTKFKPKLYGDNFIYNKRRRVSTK